MSLLPAQFRNRDPLPALGHKIVPPATKKPDPISDFETGFHSIDGSVIRRVENTPVRIEKTTEAAREQARQKYRDRLYELKSLGFTFNTTKMLDAVNPKCPVRNVRLKPMARVFRDAQQWIEEEAIEAGFHFDIASARFTKG